MRAPARGDLVAGVTVALILVPQSMAYAELAGLPAVHGLYAAAVAPLAGALVGSSPYLQTGPAPLTSLLTFSVVVALAAPSTPEAAVLAMGLAVLVGLVRLIVGLLRGGVIAFVMSQPVVTSFTFAAGATILASQLPALVGMTAGGGGNPATAALGVLSQPSRWSAQDLAIGILTILVMVLGRRVAPWFPAALVVIVGASVWSARTGYDGHVVGEIPIGLTLGTMPPPGAMADLVLPAVLIALVGFAEPASIARRYAAEDRTTWDPDRELVGQGLANLASGMAGGYPVGGSFSRTALNRLSGARTRWSGAVTGLVVLALLPVAHLLAPLPQAALAGIVIAAVAGLLDPRPMLQYWRLSRPQMLVAGVTVAATLITAPRVERGLLLGIGTSLAVHLWRELHVPVASERLGTTLHLRPNGVLYFGSTPPLEHRLLAEISAHPDIDRVVIHLGRVGRLDLTGALMLRDTVADAAVRGIRVDFVDAAPAQAELLARVLDDPTPG